MVSGYLKLLVSLLVVAILVIPANADLVGLWRFDEGSGTDANDSSGYGHHAELYAGPDGLIGGSASASTVPHWITRGSGYAVEMGTRTQGVDPDLNNTNWNYVYVLGDYQPALANLGLQWTIAFWYNQYENDPSLNIGGGAGYQRVISCPKYEYELGVPSWSFDYFWPYYESGGIPYFQTILGATPSLDTWHHIAVVYDGSELKKYVDGILDSAATVSIASQQLPNSWAPGEWLYFGRQTYPEKDFFIGGLDDVAIFNEALDLSQITEIKDGNFVGPWEIVTVEDDDPVTYLYDPSFIIRYENGEVPLVFGEKSYGHGSWNWSMEGNLGDPNYYGLVNAGLWDGTNSIEYAGYCTLEDQITQISSWKPIHNGIKYDFTARVGGEDAVGNIVGVKFYQAEAADTNNLTLLADLNQTIAANEQWYELSGTFTADANHHLDKFKVVCYVDQGSGNGRGTAFGYFDYVRIDVNEIQTCQARIDYYGSSGLTGDVIADCKIDFFDYASIAEDWLKGGIEPNINDGEMLSNPDLFDDIGRVPFNLNYDTGAPTDWSFVPSTTDSNIAGIWNLDRDGMINLAFSGDYQPAGGSVVAYFDPNTTDMEQIAPDPIADGTTYYATAMISGSGDVTTGNPYGLLMSAVLEQVDHPTTPTTSTQVAEANFVLPHLPTWRQLALEYTGDSGSAGDYLRMRFTVDPIVVDGNNFRDPAGYGLVGKGSLTTIKPDTWPRTNLLANGDFEDYSSLPPGEYDEGLGLYIGPAPEYLDGYLNLIDYFGRYTIGPIPDWDTDGSTFGYFGLQCMLWIPAPQPAMGRTAAYFDGSIGQKVTSENIQADTYYLDFIAAYNAAAYDAQNRSWPTTDPNLAVDLYWLASGVDEPTGTLGVDYGLITSLQAPVTGPLQGGANAERGAWVSAQTSFDGTPHAGKNFYVKAYSNDSAGPSTEAIYQTFEEIILSKNPRPAIGAYTCYEQANKFGGYNPADLNYDCNVDFEDLEAFVGNWLNCTDPAGCP